MHKKITAHIDLRPVLLDLIATGMRQAEIARAIGLSRATINFAVRKNGNWMPGYEAGRLLMNLKARQQKKSTEPQEASHA